MACRNGTVIDIRLQSHRRANHDLMELFLFLQSGPCRGNEGHPGYDSIDRTSQRKG